jgi:hypothetical protein
MRGMAVKRLMNFKLTEDEAVVLHMQVKTHDIAHEARAFNTRNDADRALIDRCCRAARQRKGISALYDVFPHVDPPDALQNALLDAFSDAIAAIADTPAKTLAGLRAKAMTVLVAHRALGDSDRVALSLANDVIAMEIRA